MVFSLATAACAKLIASSSRVIGYDTSRISLSLSIYIYIYIHTRLCISHAHTRTVHACCVETPQVRMLVQQPRYQLLNKKGVLVLVLSVVLMLAIHVSSVSVVVVVSFWVSVLALVSLSVPQLVVERAEAIKHARVSGGAKHATFGSSQRGV